MNWLYLIPRRKRRRDTRQDVLPADWKSWPGLDARHERIAPPPLPYTPDEAAILAGLAADAETMPHTPLVLHLADQVAGLYCRRYPDMSADQIARMLVIFHTAARRMIDAGALAGDIADAAGQAAVVLARRPDVPAWSNS